MTINYAFVILQVDIQDLVADLRQRLEDRQRFFLMKLVDATLKVYEETAPADPSHNSAGNTPQQRIPRSAFLIRYYRDGLKDSADISLTPEYARLAGATTTTGPYVIRGNPLHWIDKATGEDRYAQYVTHPGHRNVPWQQAAKYRLGPAAVVAMKDVRKAFRDGTV